MKKLSHEELKRLIGEIDGIDLEADGDDKKVYIQIGG